VQIFSRAGHAQRASGAALFGPDLGRWPGWAVDTLVVLEIERIKEHNARMEAEAAERSHG
jgi:hypothetical protein